MIYILFSLLLGLFLRINLVTELEVDILRTYTTTLQCSLGLSRRFLRDLIPISVYLWRIQIRLSSGFLYSWIFKVWSHFFIFGILIILIICDDIELNSGPKNKYCGNSSLCYWKFNSAAADDFFKLCQLKTYNFQHISIICLSEA